MTQEAAGKVLDSYKKRKRNPKGDYAANIAHGKHNKQAGGDTGYAMQYANDYHDGDGKFTGNGSERARILENFQLMHNLPVTGIIDTETSALLKQLNKVVKNED